MTICICAIQKQDQYPSMSSGAEKEQFKLIKPVFTFRDGESRWQQDYWLYLAK